MGVRQKRWQRRKPIACVPSTCVRPIYGLVPNPEKKRANQKKKKKKGNRGRIRRRADTTTKSAVGRGLLDTKKKRKIMQRTDDCCDPRQRHKDTDDRAHDDRRDREKDDHNRGRDDRGIARCGDREHPTQQRARDKINERPCAVVCAPRPQPPLVEGRHFLVAEIHGCYRPAWRTFAMAAAMTAAACRGLVGRRIPAGTRIVSAIALHDPPGLQADAAAHLSALGAQSPLTFDRLVVLLSWPSRSHSHGINWVAASLADGPGAPRGRDSTRRNGDDDDDAVEADGDMDCRAYSRPTAGPYDAMLQQAARITGECLHTAVCALVADTGFRRHHTAQRDSCMLAVGWRYSVHDPTLAESVVACPDGTLMHGCRHVTADPSCVECDTVWANSEDLLPCTRVTTRRAGLRHVVRRAVADGIALDATAPAKAVLKAQPAPRRRAAAAATTTGATRTMSPVVAAAATKGARVGAPSDRADPRCGRALCPSRLGRVDASACASVRVRCTAGCRVVFHRACWRAVADQALARGDESPCVTPDCWGLMASVVSLAPQQSGGATGRSARTKHIEWQATALRSPEKQVRHGPPDATSAIMHWDHIDDLYVEHGAPALPTDTVHDEIEGVAACAADVAAVDEDAVIIAADDVCEPTQPAVLLDVAARTYRKDRQQTGTAARAKAKRTRTRTQKRQRVRARQKIGLDDLPGPVPWHGDDDQWPSFFVGGATTPPATSTPRKAPPAIDRPVCGPTVWRFATWYPSTTTRAPPDGGQCSPCATLY